MNQPLKWTCPDCGAESDHLPLCFGSKAPWHYLVPEYELAERVELNADQCVVDGKTFFIRGHIEIPILERADTLSFSVWSSLSEKSFVHMCERWDDHDRDPPYFGWLCSEIPCYPSTIHLKLSVQSRRQGLVPLITVEESDHPLSIDHHQGISVQRWQQIAHELLHR